MMLRCAYRGVIVDEVQFPLLPSQVNLKASEGTAVM